MLIKMARNDVYKDAWRKMTPLDIASGIRMKASRIFAMLEVGADTEKIFDDIKDLAVYCYFLYARLKGEKNNGEENVEMSEVWFNNIGDE